MESNHKQSDTTDKNWLIEAKNHKCGAQDVHFTTGTQQDAERSAKLFLECGYKDIRVALYTGCSWEASYDSTKQNWLIEARNHDHGAQDVWFTTTTDKAAERFAKAFRECGYGDVTVRRHKILYH